MKTPTNQESAVLRQVPAGNLDWQLCAALAHRRSGKMGCWTRIHREPIFIRSKLND